MSYKFQYFSTQTVSTRQLFTPQSNTETHLESLCLNFSLKQMHFIFTYKLYNGWFLHPANPGPKGSILSHLSAWNPPSEECELSKSFDVKNGLFQLADSDVQSAHWRQSEGQLLRYHPGVYPKWQSTGIRVVPLEHWSPMKAQTSCKSHKWDYERVVCCEHVPKWPLLRGSLG